uniref:Uncharacterized protein n=1 Tax=Cucumis melo TaxID=3656 RepID=A0A9I9ELD0_CUCME
MWLIQFQNNFKTCSNESFYPDDNYTPYYTQIFMSISREPYIPVESLPVYNTSPFSTIELPLPPSRISRPSTSIMAERTNSLT